MFEQINYLEKSKESSEKTVLEKISELKKQRQKENFEDKLQYLPLQVREMVMGDMERLRGYGKLSEEELQNEQRIRAEEAYEGLVDSRFNLPNKIFAKTEIKRELDNIFSNDLPKEIDFKKMARLSFDLDGLKPINDLNQSHEKGDKYLGRVAAIFKDREFTDELRKMGLETIMSVDGGNEFGIILKGEFDLSAKRSEFSNDSAINFIVRKIKEKVADLRMDDLLDFKNSDIRKKFENEGILVPEGYKFKASISGGGATFFEGLKNFQFWDGLSYELALEKIMGGILDKSDEQMNKDKDEGMRKLEESIYDGDKFHLLVRSRNKEEMGLRMRIQKSREDKEMWGKTDDYD